MTFIQFAVLGVGTGAVYALLAVGLVVIHRGSGVINFAQGAVGMTATFFFWNIRDVHHSPFVLAFAYSLAIAAGMGILIQLLIMRPLRAQSSLTRMLATLGVLISLSSAVTLKYPQNDEFVQSFLPTGNLKFGSVFVPISICVLTGIVVALTAVLYAVYRYTYFGIATTAVVENRDRAASARINPDLIATINWVIGSVLAATAGILIAPSAGLSVNGLTLLIIPALAVAVVGRFASFPIVFAVGLAIGIGQTELERFAGNNSSAWVTALPFFVMIVYFVVRGKTLPTKGDQSIRLPRVGTGKVRIWAVLLLGIVGYIVIEVSPVNWAAGMITTGITAIIVLSVVVVTGYAGQLSLAQFAMAGAGAYVSARLTADTGAPFAVSLLVGVLVALPIGVLVGLPALRTRGENLAIATLGLSVALSALVFTNLSLTGGISGFHVGNPDFLGINLTDLLRPENYAVFVLVCFMIAALVVARIRRGVGGRRMLAVRDNETAAASLGINVVATKLYAFAVSSMLAALGGVLFAFETPIVTFGAYNPLASISVVSYGVIGGLGYNASAPIIGGSLAPGAVSGNIVDLFNSSVQEYLGLASGLILILVLIINPDGVTPSNIDIWDRFVRPHLRRMPLKRFASNLSNGGEANDLLDGPRKFEIDIAPQTLSISNVSVAFGGVSALNAVSLEVAPGSVVGLIGPNGAGKTTLIETVTGFVQHQIGTVSLGSTSLEGMSPRHRAKLGIARTFQAGGLFGDLTVRENLLVANEGETTPSSFFKTILRSPQKLSQGAQMAIDQFGLASVLNSFPGDLPYGRQRVVSIARALARNPSILLLDEPAAGLGEADRDELSELIIDLARSRNVGILLVEHDVELVMRTCTQVVALEFGSVIASGSPDEVRRDPAVIRAYLGDSRPDGGSISNESIDSP